MPKVYLTRKQVSEQYPIAYSTLAHLAMQGRGPVYRRCGKNTIYRADEVESWLEEQIIGPVKVTRRRGGRRNQSRAAQRASLSNNISVKQLGSDLVSKQSKGANDD